MRRRFNSRAIRISWPYSLVIATAEGETDEARELAGTLASFGYEVEWEPELVRLTHIGTGQQMERRI